MDATYLAGLNEPQIEAVTHSGGPLLVEAGPGSGKTRVLACRVARLIDTGMPAGRILAITFTNKAANEMRSRIEHLLSGRAAAMVGASTFHSACVKVLRSDIALVRPHQDFKIIDTGQVTKMLRSVIQDLGYDAETNPPAKVRARISAAKNRYRSPEQIEQAGLEADACGDPNAGDIILSAEVYAEYDQRLIRAGCVDFDDLLMLTLRVFKEHPDALNRWRGRYEHLLVDEYQDTNLVQNEIALLLTARHRQLTAVGDSDQGIYAFRGADTRNILQLQDHFEDLRIVHLGRNYRSTANIVAAASAVVAHNQDRRDKRLWTSRPAGPAIQRYTAADETDEAAWVVASIAARRQQREADWGDTAILYRVNAQSRPLEHCLAAAGVPYRMLSGPSFYERKEIADALAYLRAIADPDDGTSVRRALRNPSRYVGAKTIAQIEDYARNGGLSILQALREHRNLRLWHKAAQGISEFLATLAAAAAANDPYGALGAIIERSGMRKRLIAEGTDEALDRLANLTELQGAARGHDTLEEFLAEIARVVASADSDADTDDAVSLSTLHSAKGLEFQDVYIVGLEEGLLPHRLAASSRTHIEEERRLAYVGMTRAMDRLAVSCATVRRLYDDQASNLPSRFLAEIPEHLLAPPASRPDLKPRCESAAVLAPATAV